MYKLQKHRNILDWSAAMTLRAKFLQEGGVISSPITSFHTSRYSRFERTPCLYDAQTIHDCAGASLARPVRTMKDFTEALASEEEERTICSMFIPVWCCLSH
jgi:hypothetical protein